MWLPHSSGSLNPCGLVAGDELFVHILDTTPSDGRLPDYVVYCVPI